MAKPVSEMTDQELVEHYAKVSKAAAKETAAPDDVAKMSDEDLEKLADRSRPQRPDMGAAIAAAGTSENTLEDAPTTGRLVLPGIRLPFNKGKDIEGNEGLPPLDHMALMYGTLSTDSPKGRQEIYTKNLPGAKAVEDKWGNPMIEYKGKRYYTSRPGEFDAMDMGRLTAGVAGTLPTMAVAPAGLLAATGVGAGLALTQSVAEDVVARASGATDQPWINVEKALWSGAFGGAFPLILKGSPLIAGRLNELIKGGAPLTDDALRAIGMTDDQIGMLTPEIRDQVSTVAKRTFNNKGATTAAFNKGVADEFGVTPNAEGVGGLTRSEITGDSAQRSLEQTLSQTPNAGRAPAASIMRANQVAQDANLNAAQKALQARAGGGKTMTGEEASASLKEYFGTINPNTGARGLTDDAIDRAYKYARDPIAVVEAGGTMAVPAKHVNQFAPTVRANLQADDIGRTVIDDPKVTPYAKESLDIIDKFSGNATKKGTLLRTAIDEPPITKYPEITWERAEAIRQQLSDRLKLAQEAANAPGKSGTSKDVAVMGKILAEFDDHFGKLNPLYAPARKAHEEMMQTFVSGAGKDQDQATRQVLKVLGGPEGGEAVTNVILGSHVNNNTAAKMIDHLQTKVFPDNPEARNVLRQQFLRRITEKADGTPYSAQMVVNNIKDALGDRQRTLYGKLFDEKEIAEIKRFQHLNKMIADSRGRINPPGSGLFMAAVMQGLNARNAGAVAGGTVGSLLGPWGAAGGAAAGGAIGQAVDLALPVWQAARAVKPGAGYGVAPVTSVPSLLSRNAAPLAADAAMPPPGPSTVGPDGKVTPGPADRILENLRGF